MAGTQIPLYAAGGQPDAVGVELQAHCDAHGAPSYYIHQASYDDRYANDAKDAAKHHLVTSLTFPGIQFNVGKRLSWLQWDPVAVDRCDMVAIHG